MEFGGRYEVQEFLGQGGMGDVYSALDRRLGRLVALKVLRPGASQDQASLTRFLREARAVASLDHPSFVTVFDVADDPQQPFIVMELVQGESLETLLRRERTVRPERAAAIAADIADAIAIAHDAGIVHRDLKPSNVMITSSGTLKVLDFGIARAMAWTPLTSRKIIQGTVEYISPEQARGEPLDGRSDVYSLGVLLYEMLLGRPPFTNENPVALLYKHLEETPAAPHTIDPQIPLALSHIVMRSLAKAPSDRPSSATELRNSLRAGAEPTARSNPDPSGTRRTEPRHLGAPTAQLPRRRTRPFALSAAVLLTGLDLGLFVPSVMGGEEPKKQSKPAPPVLEAPVEVSLSSACSGFTSAEATITWSPSGSPDVDGYVVSRSTEGGAYEELPRVDGSAATGVVDEGLATGTNYHFKVQATAGDRSSEHSPAVAIGTPILCMW